MGKGPDAFSGFLKFPDDELRNPNPPELLKSRPGGRSGESVDSAGNVYDERGNLIREMPDPYFMKALALLHAKRPDVPEDDLMPQARIEARMMRIREGKQIAKRHSQKRPAIDLKSAGANDLELES
jgi:hypothetical protein